MAAGNFADALAVYEGKGAIRWAPSQAAAEAQLVQRWAQDSAASPGKSRFVFCYTNAEVDRMNASLRQIRKERGELGAETVLDTAHGRLPFAVGDRVQFTKTEKPAGIINGAAGRIEAIDGHKITVALDSKTARSVTFDAAAFQHFRHGYAGTIYRGQGRTLDQSYLLHSEHWRSASSYVALTRHRERTALFVARPVAKDVDQLARQMARADGQQAASRFHVHPAIGWREAKQARQQQAAALEVEHAKERARQAIAEREAAVGRMAAERAKAKRDPADYWRQRIEREQDREKPAKETEAPRVRHRRGISLGR
jgi:hypothetical protein